MDTEDIPASRQTAEKEYNLTPSREYSSEEIPCGQPTADTRQKTPSKQQSANSAITIGRQDPSSDYLQARIKELQEQLSACKPRFPTGDEEYIPSGLASQPATSGYFPTPKAIRHYNRATQERRENKSGSRRGHKRDSSCSPELNHRHSDQQWSRTNRRSTRRSYSRDRSENFRASSMDSRSSNSSGTSSSATSGDASSQVGVPPPAVNRPPDGYRPPLSQPPLAPASPPEQQNSGNQEQTQTTQLPIINRRHVDPPANASKEQDVEKDPLKIIFYLPKGASLHPEPAPKTTVFVEWGQQHYYHLSYVTLQPPAISLTDPRQVEFYSDLLMACSRSRPEEIDSSGTVLLRNSVSLFDLNALKERGFSLSIKPPRLIADLPFSLISDRINPLITKWLKPCPCEVNRDQIAKLPFNHKIKQAVLNNKLPAPLTAMLQLDNATDPLLTFLKAPLPTTAEKVAHVILGATIFSDPSVETLTKYFEQKQLCLRFLTQVMSAETSIIACKELVESTPPSDLQTKLMSLAQWMTHARLSIEGQLKESLRLTILLHLQLRHEALAKQKSDTLYRNLMNAEPLICDQLFPQTNTAYLLDNFKDLVVTVDNQRKPATRRAPPTSDSESSNSARSYEEKGNSSPQKRHSFQKHSSQRSNRPNKGESSKNFTQPSKKGNGSSSMK